MTKPKKVHTGSFVERRKAQLESEQEETTRLELDRAARSLHGPGPGEPEGPVIDRELATKYYEKTSSWMHRFSDVRSDNDGFFILHKDNSDA